jgi:hypothetical protein
MFNADAKTTNQQPTLYVVAPGPGLKGNRKGEMKMNAYKFAGYPSNSSVASGVTMLVSAWFLVAAGLILTDSSSAYTPRAAAVVAPVTHNDEPEYPAVTNVAIAPEARFTINVEARRSASL